MHVTCSRHNEPLRKQYHTRTLHAAHQKIFIIYKYTTNPMNIFKITPEVHGSELEQRGHLLIIKINGDACMQAVHVTFFAIIYYYANNIISNHYMYLTKQSSK